MSDSLLETPLTSWHSAHGARMVDFAGWRMPVQYTSIRQEHLATRRDVGLFDISHMGRLRFHGPDALRFLDFVLTRRVHSMRPGQIRYALVVNDAGGILDDVLVYALVSSDGAVDWRLVVNASNRVKLLEWFEQHREGFDVTIEDQTLSTAMVAIQGPRAIELAQRILDAAKLADCQIADLKYYTGVLAGSGPSKMVISRTGYTGEDGCEWILPADRVVSIWEQLVEAGATPAGLGARDTLRLEAGMPLYGHELDESIDPFQADLAFAVQLEDHPDFIGRQALEALAGRAPERLRVGLQAEGRRAPRQHSGVLDGGRAVGEVTSGTFSPTLEVPIAMAYVDAACADLGRKLSVDVRGHEVPVEVVALPFYRRKRT